MVKIFDVEKIKHSYDERQSSYYYIVNKNFWAKEKSIRNLLWDIQSQKDILYTNAKNNLFFYGDEFRWGFNWREAGTERRKRSKIKSEETEEGDDAATAAEEQLKAIPPGCISLLRALRPRVLIKIDLRLRRPEQQQDPTTLVVFSKYNPTDYTEDKFRTRVMRKVFRDVASLMRSEF